MALALGRAYKLTISHQNKTLNFLNPIVLIMNAKIEKDKITILK